MSFRKAGLFKNHEFMKVFYIQTLTCLSDAIFKNAFIIFISYNLINITYKQEIVILLGAFLFILPILLFSTLAGQIATKK